MMRRCMSGAAARLTPSTARPSRAGRCDSSCCIGSLLLLQFTRVFQGNDDERDAVFVDETVCIGCGKCSHVAPATFFMEEDHGRARVATQWADAKDAIQEGTPFVRSSIRTGVALG